MSDDRARIIHNTYTIISVNQAACDLFRCQLWQIIDQSMLWLISDPDFAGLAKARLRAIRETHDLGYQDLPLWRFDGTQFEGRVQTHRISGEQFESTITFLYEIPEHE